MKAARFADSHATTVDLVEDWRTSAACRGMDGELFFPADRDTIGQANAKAVCAGCSVLDSCLIDALDVEDRSGSYSREGIRGGLTGPERTAQFGKPRRKKPGRQG